MPRAEGVSPLAAARLTVPLPSTRLISRERVTRLLDRAVARPLTLVSAGPGTGKTLAVATWVREGRAPGPVAWVTLDRVVGVPSRFWGAVLTALERALEPGTLGVVQSPRSVDDEFVEALHGRLAGHQVVLVLDDVHELPADVLDGLDQLLRLPPEGLHVVLISRHDPSLSLHRHRLAGHLGEVRAADLAFTSAETRQLLEDGGVRLAEDGLAELVRISGGWAAGLRLALLSMEGASDPQRALRQFSGQQPLVAGYLDEEVMRSLGPARANFLLRTCVTDRICAPLAEVLTRDDSAPGLLRSLSGDHLLVHELGESGWSRYHPLLLQTLRSRLNRDELELEHELHRRASVWFEGAGEWLLALEHAVASDDLALSVRVGLGSSAVLVFSGHRSPLGSIISRICAQASPHDPELLMLRALGAYSQDNHARTVDLLPLVEAGVHELPEPRRTITLLNLRVLQALEARVAGDTEQLTRASEEAVRLVGGLRGEDAPGWAVFRGVPLKIVAVGQLWSGRPAAALRLLRQAMVFGQETFTGYAAVYHQGLTALALVMCGQVAAARREALAVVGQVEASPIERPHGSGPAWLALALAEQSLGHQETAASALAAGESVAVGGPDPFVPVCLALARVRAALIAGDLRGARRALARSEKDCAYPGLTYAVLLRAALEIEVELGAGNVDHALELLAAHDLRRTQLRGDATVNLDWPDEDPIELVRGLVLLASGRPEQVRAAAATAVEQSPSSAATGWVATALAEDRLRHDVLATEAMGYALDVAAPQGLVLPFRVPGGHVAAILRLHQLVDGRHGAFVQLLLQQIEVKPPAAPSLATLLEPLTERERVVVAYLPTMRSNAEIADEMGISVNTVKQHLKSVHRKLGVTSRREAVRAARQFDLLPEPAGLESAEPAPVGPRD
ncbi:LuxR C-terminal-related transcriptional regulator [Ornithinimicrobium cryptoxanthini]|uniref:LuxR C-terminal-related transcriptional regulator n=1 Tax=Ornithinimicrobium cryptoxanthini TaxID=2934161 RepID=UPI002118787B|nr:LuxR C-terminal-related transcriptional regulator [Ornithinimicrobium cryptoxanthini]